MAWTSACLLVKCDSGSFHSISTLFPPRASLKSRLTVLGGNTAIVDDDVHLVLRALGVGVDGEPIGLSQCPEGGGQRLAQALLLVRGVDDNKIFPRCLGAGPLCAGLLGCLVGFAHGWVFVLFVLVIVGDIGGVAVVVVGLVVVVMVILCNLERRQDAGVH